MGKCKVVEKCKKCKCSNQDSDGLASQIQVPRPTERVIERHIVELANRCENCTACNQTENKDA